MRPGLIWRRPTHGQRHILGRQGALGGSDWEARVPRQRSRCLEKLTWNPCTSASSWEPAPSPPMARCPGRSRIGDHARGRPFLSRLSERRRVRRHGVAGSGSAGGCPRGGPPAAACFGWRCAAGCCGWGLARRGGHRRSGSKCLASAVGFGGGGRSRCPGSGSPGGGGGSPGGGGGDVQGMYIHASNSLSCPPTAGSVGGVFGSGGSAGDGVCTLGGQASARGCAARPACASGSTTFISPGIPSNLRSEASGRLSAGELTPRCTKKGKIAATCASASGGFVLKRNLGIVAPEAAGAREAASS